jgi:hypothetical protein
MEPEDKPEFAVAIGAMCAAFGTDASKALILGYWMGLSDLSITDIQQAVARSMRESQHLPKPVELRRLAGEKTPEAAAMAAWGDVQRAIPLGPYKHVDFSDKLINATIRNLGGWPTFIGRLTDEESEKWLRLEFMKCYAALASSGVNGEACEPLTGLSQASVAEGKITAPAVLRIECSSRSTIRIAQGKRQALLVLKEVANV